MGYELLADQRIPGAWRVEAINFNGDGEVYVAIFAGPDSRERASEYAEWKSRGGKIMDDN
jgi:hypothetical protein